MVSYTFIWCSFDTNALFNSSLFWLRCCINRNDQKRQTRHTKMTIRILFYILFWDSLQFNNNIMCNKINKQQMYDSGVRCLTRDREKEVCLFNVYDVYVCSVCIRCIFLKQNLQNKMQCCNKSNKIKP